jgi:hypothetical protein
MNTILSSRLPRRSPSSTKPLLVSNRAVTPTGQRPSSSHTSSLLIIDSTADSYSAPHWKTVTMSRFAGLAARLVVSSVGHFSISFLPFPFKFYADNPSNSCHCFIKLSSDRRHIRPDRLGELQSKYKTWLLEGPIPRMYLFFFECRLRLKLQITVCAGRPIRLMESQSRRQPLRTANIVR